MPAYIQIIMCCLLKLFLPLLQWSLMAVVITSFLWDCCCQCGRSHFFLPFWSCLLLSLPLSLLSLSCHFLSVVVFFSNCYQTSSCLCRGGCLDRHCNSWLVDHRYIYIHIYIYLLLPLASENLFCCLSIWLVCMVLTRSDLMFLLDWYYPSCRLVQENMTISGLNGMIWRDKPWRGGDRSHLLDRLYCLFSVLFLVAGLVVQCVCCPFSACCDYAGSSWSACSRSRY